MGCTEKEVRENSRGLNSFSYWKALLLIESFRQRKPRPT